MNTAKTYIVAGLGEILWDVIGTEEKLGGAPINFAFHAAQQGAKAFAISAIGDDLRGKKTIKALQNKNIQLHHIQQLTGETTGYVVARVDNKGVAHYDFPDDVAWDKLVINQDVCELIPQLDAVCFGSLAQRNELTRDTIYHYLTLADKKQKNKNTLKVFDLNVRQHFYTQKIIEDSLLLANVLKLNDEELDLLAKLLILKGSQQEQLQQILHEYSLDFIALTRGAKGSLLVSKDGVSDHPGLPCSALDTIGAGDSFTSTIIMGLLQGLDLETINEHANRVASYICQHTGAMVSLPKELIS